MMVTDSVIIDQKAINLVAKSYSTLDYYLKISESLKRLYAPAQVEALSKYELHKLLNDTLLKNYHGEEILKYKLSCHYFDRANTVAAFEIKVNNSRVDFLTINGNTSSFEIKTGLDNLSKLDKQLADYMLAFEFNYVVLDQRHIERAKNIIPEGCGLWSYKNGVCKKEKNAELSKSIDAEVQLKLLSKRELLSSFPQQDGVLKEILISYTPKNINRIFKRALKERYRNRWEFLKVNQGTILPIDTQFFFNTNIEPQHIYY